MDVTRTGRRRFASTIAIVGGAAVVGCREGGRPVRVEPDGRRGSPKPEGHDEVRAEDDAEALITPGEDLMREHGVLERVLVVWAEADAPLRTGGDIELSALRSSVELVQRFVEGYHERLEEDLVFPRLEQAGREREIVRVLRDQHEVGRGATAEVSSLLSRPLDADARLRVANRLAAYSRMYLAHASREDTIVFPALREIVGARYAELGEDFEHREHEIVGEGGFDRAVEEIARIERAFGLEDLAVFTPERSPA